jgi:hypothetical protein
VSAYGESAFGEKAAFAEKWKESPQAGHLETFFPELYRLVLGTFSGETLNAEQLGLLIDERLREMKDPEGELGKLAPLVEETARRLEDLPLDMQTGKDGRAAETVGVFSGLAEKVLRVFGILEAEGFGVSGLLIEGVSVYTVIGEFGTALKEMLAAYESKDLVLVGDIAEYELAPRLRNIFGALKKPV